MTILGVRELFLMAAQGLSERVVTIDARSALFPGGRNGPYFDIESPIRNSAHVLVAMSVAHHLTGSTRFAELGRQLTHFLLTAEALEQGSVLVHRQKRNKDGCNGVIGPAWVIEALALAGRLLQHDGARARARALADDQSFDSRAALWRRRDPNGGPSGVDRTLNHQVAFAAALQGASEEEDPRVRLFLDHLAGGGLRVEDDGLLIHHVPRRDEVEHRALGGRERFLRAAANSQHVARLRQRSLDDHRARDIGYHLYALFCLARLCQLSPSHPLWASDEMARALSLPSRDGWLESLAENPYAYPYNGPGLELPLIAAVFSIQNPALAELSSRAVERQMALTWDGATRGFNRGSVDALTLMARSFELGLALI